MILDDKWNIDDRVMFFNENNKLLGIYEKLDDKLIVWKNFK